MKIEEIFTRGLKYWPAEIDISDGEFTQNGAFYSYNFVKIKDDLEHKTRKNDWDSFGVWSFYTLYIEMLKRTLKRVFIKYIYQI
ncbi:MAG TPA: hypothetical protein VK590_00170 [Saprospiraceae bacterium]|nr:hypothetical protein [Saprospiraceae bacterium]